MKISGKFLCTILWQDPGVGVDLRLAKDLMGVVYIKHKYFINSRVSYLNIFLLFKKWNYCRVISTDHKSYKHVYGQIKTVISSTS